MQNPAPDFEKALAAQLSRRLRVHIPRQTELFRRRPRSHFHATPEFFIQTGGGTDFVCPSKSFRLRTGEVCVIPSGVPHAETPVDLKTPYGILVCMHGRDGFFICRACATPRREIIVAGTDHFVSPRGRAAFRYLDELGSIDRIPAKHRAKFTKNLIEAFLITLLGELRQPSPVEQSGSHLVTETEKRIRAHLTDPELSVRRLAAALRCSPDYLSRKFHAERGTTLTGWITGLRMQMAKELLSETRFNISEVSWACGFHSPSYFIRVFRQHAGVTPKDYRAGIS